MIVTVKRKNYTENDDSTNKDLLLVGTGGGAVVGGALGRHLGEKGEGEVYESLNRNKERIKDSIKSLENSLKNLEYVREKRVVGNDFISELLGKINALGSRPTKLDMSKTNINKLLEERRAELGTIEKELSKHKSVINKKTAIGAGIGAGVGLGATALHNYLNKKEKD